VRVVGVFHPQKWTEPKPGVWVADLGQNLAGVPRLTVKGRPGQRIQLRFAERLNPDGTIYTTNLRSARATDTYICRGGGVETWTPRFTFHGFQYVEVTGLDGKPGPDTIAGLALSSATPAAGRFECSDPMLSRLWTNTVWTQYANFIDIPTDCPQRDERLGWTGDAQAYIRTACMNNDVQAFFTKWLIDLEDAQRADGQFPMVAPLKVAGDDGGPAWADAGVICPWTVYDVYGDRRALDRHYPAMVRFLDFCVKRSTPELLPPEKFHCFGDWLHINADTPKDVIYTAYFAMSARIAAQAADVLGKADDAAKFRELYGRVKAAFQKAYVGADGKIKGDSQTVYILAIVGDLVDGAQREQAAKHLVANIEARENHLSTGFVGTRDIMHALSKIGRQDVAYRLLHNDTFPSWGFTIRHGATTIWERWDGWTPDKGFQTPGMNSFAHYAFGAVYQWMVENIGGIRNDAPGYRKIRIAPAIDPKLEWARVSYDSPAGPIVSAWRKAKSGAMTFDIEIPANTTATVVLPAASAAALTEGGRPLSAASGVKVLREAAGTVELAIGSGRYGFAVAVR
jgi:alpha-L-rhamnosidase